MNERQTAVCHRWRLALIALVPLLAALLPQAAGLQDTLRVSVRYARLELPERAPALIRTGLPKAVYTVSPASLGYFAPGGDFVFTADVARGLIYGRAGADSPAYVVEIAAPPQAEEFIDGYLERIRSLTREVNTRRNRLRLERLAEEAECADPFVAGWAADFWQAVDGAQPERISANWMKRVSAQGPATVKLLCELLPAQSEHRGKMKTLYYDAYETRVALLLAQFDLQLALARLPRRSGEQLLPQPGVKEIAQLTLKNTAELRSAWETRRGALAVLLQAGVETAPPTANALKVTSFMPGTNARAQPATGQSEQLAAAAQQAQLRVWQAEAGGLDRALQALGQAEAAVAQQAGQAQDSLPRYTLPATAFDLPVLKLGDAAQIDELAPDPPLAAWLLLKLARLFEGGRGAPGPAAIEEQLSHLRPKGLEVPCGVVAVDRCLRQVPARAAGIQPAVSGGLASATPDAQPPADSAADLPHTLDAILADPNRYGVAALDLGYLRFMRWYTGLVADSLAPAAH